MLIHVQTQTSKRVKHDECDCCEPEDGKDGEDAKHGEKDGDEGGQRRKRQTANHRSEWRLLWPLPLFVPSAELLSSARRPGTKIRV